MNPTLRQRNDQLRREVYPLPGSQPHDNVRPIRIPGRMDRWRLIDCVCELHPPIAKQTWIDWFEQGLIQRYGLPANPMLEVRGGEAFDHVFPNTVEPDVNADVTILAEDAHLIVVNKPAPLPVHASGRFERNTLIGFLRRVFDEKLRPVHRLDANTTGLMLVARTSEAARSLAEQFESGSVQKRYLVRCHGIPPRTRFRCDASISEYRTAAGARVVDEERGKHARTDFRVIKTLADDSALLEARPLTGRTNQIRIHLWSLGMPIVGDPSYLQNGQLAASQTLDVAAPPMCLHAATLRLIDPSTGEPRELRASPPDWSGMDQDAFSSFASDSSFAISSSNCFNSERSSA